MLIKNSAKKLEVRVFFHSMKKEAQDDTECSDNDEHFRVRFTKIAGDTSKWLKDFRYMIDAQLRSVMKPPLML